MDEEVCDKSNHHDDWNNNGSILFWSKYNEYIISA